MSSSVSSVAAVKFFVLLCLPKFVIYDISRAVSDETYLILIFEFVCFHHYWFLQCCSSDNYCSVRKAEITKSGTSLALLYAFFWVILRRLNFLCQWYIQYVLYKVQLHVSTLDNGHLQVVHEMLSKQLYEAYMGCILLGGRRRGGHEISCMS